MHDLDSLQQFLQDNDALLRARSGWNAHDLEDLRQSVGIVVLEFAHGGLPTIDLRDPAHARDVLREAFRRYDRERRQRSLSLDFRYDLPDGKPGSTWVDAMEAPVDSNPLEAILREEERGVMRAMLEGIRTATYSEFTAYMTALLNFECVKDDVAAHLAISTAAFERRVLRSYEYITEQRSLFDLILVIASDFIPVRGAARPRRRSPAVEDIQHPLPLIAAETSTESRHRMVSTIL